MALCFLDTETDGIHPGRQAWDVAMIRRDDTGERTLSFYVELNLSTADPFGLNVGRFYDRHPMGQFLAGHRSKQPLPLADAYNPDFDYTDLYLSPWTAAQAVARWTHGAHIVGAVPNFDTETLAALLRERGLTPAWHYHLIDVEALAVGFLHGVHRSTEWEPTALPALPWESDGLSRALGVDPPSEDERHTALGDARWAMRLYDAIVPAEVR